MNKDEIIDVATELTQYANELAKESGVRALVLLVISAMFSLTSI